MRPWSDGPAPGRSSVAGRDRRFAPGKRAPFKAERPIRKLDGDLDVLGDGSVTIISTPGHTLRASVAARPSSEDRLGRAERRPDALQGQLDNRLVASMNTSAEQTQASFKRVADLIAEKKAQLQKHSPEFYE